MTNKPQGTLYIGVTNNIIRRAFEHRNGRGKGFTKKYKLTILVYAEEFERISDALEREKKLKNWRRQWKIELIESVNPKWNDYYNTHVYH